MINLAVTDQSTGELVHITMGFHDAHKLYKALRELVGDIQYEKQPGKLITVPRVHIPINTG